MKKRVISILLIAMLIIGMLPVSAFAADDTASTEAITPDTAWYTANADATTYYLYDAADLLGFAALGAEGKDFSGKTVMLMADIDLNPGWNANVTIGDTVVFPEAPTTVWPTIASFKGVLDGNGYTISGIYSSKTVASNKGAYGGLFNTLDGGTVKNLRISNSLMHTQHLTNGTTLYGSADIHVGGIAGNVNEGSKLYQVYMDHTVQIWYQSNAHCMLGGAFGYAAGAYTVEGFVFVGRIGNTGNACTANYDVGSNKMTVALITANQNSKGGSITNSHTLKSGIYMKNNWLGESGNDRVAQVNKNATINCVANTKESAAWLETRPNDYGKNFTWSDHIQGIGETTVGSIIPKVAVDIVNGTFEHITDQASKFVTPEISYQIATVSGGDYNIRFVSGINEIAGVKRVGFDITLHVNGESYQLPLEQALSDMVYTSVLADGETVAANQVNAAYEYLYTCVIKGIPAADDVVIEIAVVYECEDTTLTGSPVYFAFSNGIGQII